MMDTLRDLAGLCARCHVTARARDVVTGLVRFDLCTPRGARSVMLSEGVAYALLPNDADKWRVIQFPAGCRELLGDEEMATLAALASTDAAVADLIGIETRDVLSRLAIWTHSLAPDWVRVDWSTSAAPQLAPEIDWIVPTVRWDYLAGLYVLENRGEKYTVTRPVGDWAVGPGYYSAYAVWYRHMCVSMEDAFQFSDLPIPVGGDAAKGWEVVKM